MTTSYPIGVSSRGWDRPGGPLRHAYTPAPASRFGRNVRAVCGTSIRPTPYPPGPFDPDHARACPRCRAALR